MNKNISNVVDNVLLVFGFTYALNDIESILGITLLIIQLLWLFSKFFIKLYDKIKKKDFTGIDKDIKDLEKDTSDLIESTKKGSDEHGNN